VCPGSDDSQTVTDSVICQPLSELMPGRSIGSVAKGLGLRDSVLRRWREQRGARLEPTAAARRSTTQATLPSADHAAEIARLQRENERLRMERDILKKSIAIFAGTRT
jgi:transposase